MLDEQTHNLFLGVGSVHSDNMLVPSFSNMAGMGMSSCLTMYSNLLGAWITRYSLGHVMRLNPQEWTTIHDRRIDDDGKLDHHQATHPVLALVTTCQVHSPSHEACNLDDNPGFDLQQYIEHAELLQQEGGLLVNGVGEAICEAEPAVEDIVGLEVPWGQHGGVSSVLQHNLHASHGVALVVLAHGKHGDVGSADC